MRGPDLLNAASVSIAGERWRIRPVVPGSLTSGTGRIVIIDAFERFEPDELVDAPTFHLGRNLELRVTFLVAEPPGDSSRRSTPLALIVGEPTGEEWHTLSKANGEDVVVFCEGGALFMFPIERHSSVLEIQDDASQLLAVVNQAAESGPLQTQGVFAVASPADAFACWGSLGSDGLLSSLLVDFDAFRG